MTSDDLIRIYSTRKSTFTTQHKAVQRRSLAFSWARGVVALGFLVLIYLTFQHGAVFGWGALVVVVVYAVLVQRHERLKYQKTLLENLITLNDQEINAQQGNHAAFSDGEEFADGNHPYAADLDMFGKGSLFQRVNRTCTGTGKERLATALARPLTTEAEILQRQQAIEELSKKIDFRQQFYAVGTVSVEKKEDQSSLLEWLKLPAMVYGKKKYQVMLIVFPIVALAALGYWIFTGAPGPLIIVALIEWGIIGAHAKRVTAFQNYIGSKRRLLEKFAEHFRLLQQETFSSDILVAMASRCTEAYGQVRLLASRSRALDLRLNIFASLLLNSTMLYDLFCVYRLEKWRVQNQAQLGAWLEAIQEADALSSMGTYRYNHPDFVFPSVHEAHTFVAEQLGHPLLPAHIRVCNDVQMGADENVWIVTGANMAGKSTFLRTLGMNVVLGLAGLPVCARRMACPLVEIYTGMRTTDSINDHQSYFFAELLRLQKIIRKLQEGKQLLILLDEILKGTNSADKLTGSEELVKQLVKQPAFTIIATHDVALGDLSSQYSQIKNYHFETFIKGDDLSFDYILKPGVSTGKNATFLMRKMGIIEAQEVS